MRVHEGEVGPEGPAEHVHVGQPALPNHGERRLDVVLLPDTVPEAPLAGASGAGDTAEVESEHRHPQQRRQPVGGLADDVGVHETAVGGQRVQAQQRGDGIAVGRQRQLPDQCQPVGGVQLDFFTACREPDGGPELDGLTGGGRGHPGTVAARTCRRRGAGRPRCRS